MNVQEKFVYNTILNLSLNSGASSESAYNAAKEGVTRYKRHKFKKIDQLVKDQVSKAKKLSEE